MSRNLVGRRELLVGPTEEPITLQDVKDHTRVDINADDGLLSGLVVAAREQLEEETNRAFVTQTWKLFLDEFPPDPKPIVLPKPPLRAVDSVQFTDDDGTTQTLPSTDFIVDTASEPGRIVVKRNKNWPTETLQAANGVEIEFEAGYGGVNDVPQRVKQALMLLVAHWYEHREAVTTGEVPRVVQRALGDLVATERVRMLA